MKSKIHDVIKNRNRFILNFLIPIFILITMIACSRSAANAEAYVAESKIAKDSLISDRGTQSKDSNTDVQISPQWMRTAELKFKVSDILKSTDAIESIAQQFNGSVIDTKLNTVIVQTNQTAIHKDSSSIATHYNRTNTIILRVPNTKLDTILKCISRNALFLDYRNIKSEDVSSQSLTNTLSQNRVRKTESRLENAIATKRSKLTETVEAETLLNNQAEQKDQAYIDQFILNDKIKWSTIVLHIYEKENINYEIISHEKTMIPYAPSLGQEFISAISTGWNICIRSLIFLLNIWPIIIIGIALYFILKRRKIVKAGMR